MKNIIYLLVFITFNVSYSQNKLYSDEFDNNSLKDWKRFYQEEQWPDMMENISIENGMLIMEPYTCGWYADYHAPFVFKEIEGDFTVTARIKIEGRAAKAPKALWSLAGLMVRVPRDITKDSWTPNGENWLFITTGFARNLEQPVIETKNTVNSYSDLKLTPAKLDWIELRIERSNSRFKLMYKYDNATDWTLVDTFNRKDFPNKLQVGTNAYTDYYSAGSELMSNVYKYNSTVVKYGKPDLKVLIDYIRFE